MTAGARRVLLLLISSHTKHVRMFPPYTFDRYEMSTSRHENICERNPKFTKLDAHARTPSIVANLSVATLASLIFGFSKI